MNEIELLAPVGSFDALKAAVQNGANAVYLGGKDFSARASANNFDREELIEAVKYAHIRDVRVFVTTNTLIKQDEIEDFVEYAKFLYDIDVDALIMQDIGVAMLIHELLPDFELHASTQMVAHSLEDVQYLESIGFKRVVLARELTVDEIKYICDNTNVDIEIFVHGAICYSYSGRCNLSDFLASRCGNLGDCAQSCRWAYNMYIEEKNNPGNLMPVEQDQNGTYILSSKDLCLIKEIPEIVDMGIDSLKIEGRLKTEYYLATVISAYRNAIDDYIKNPEEYDYTKYLKELEKTKTRGLTTFYFNDKNNRDFQEYEGKQYNPDFEFGGKVLEKNVEGKDIIEIRNRLQVGDSMELLVPNKLEPEKFIIEEMWDIETKEPITHVNPGKEGQKVILKIPTDVKEGWILRRKK